MGNRLIWYSFLAIVAYLVLANWKGANALLTTGFSGYGKVVRTFQGR